MSERIRSWIETYILIVLAIRPSLDITTDWAIPLGPVTLNPAGIISLSILAVGFLWLFILEKDERSSLLHHPAVLLFGAWLLLMIPWAIGPIWIHGTARLASGREWIRLLSFLPLFAILMQIAQRGRGNKVLAVLFLSLIIPALTGLYQIAFHQGMLVQNAHRIQSTFAHPNPFSFYLVMMVGLAYWKCRYAQSPLIWGFVLLLTLGLLIATYSFTGAGMLGVLILAVAMGENKKIRVAILGLLILFTILFVTTPTGQQRIRTITQWDNLNEIERTGRETSSMVWRLLNWRFLIRTWKESPWVGYGLDSSQFVNPNRTMNRTGPGQEPHNDYVRFLIDTGGIGVVLYLIWLAGLGTFLLRAHRQANAPPVRGFALIAMALYGTWLAGSANDNLIIATAYQYCLWSVFAIALGWNVSSSESEETMRDIPL